MKKNNHRENMFNAISGTAAYALCAVVPLVLFLIMVWLDWINHTDLIQPLMLLGIFLTLGFVICRAYTRGFRTEDLIFLVMALGFIMRVGYMLYTAYNVRAHDIGWIGEDSHGHAQYIWNLFQGHQLPQVNHYQFYHPPFFHILSLIPIKIASLAFPDAANEVWLDGAKVVSCFASCAGLVVMKRLCKELQLGQKASVVILAIAALHPNFFLLAGRVNNDSLVIFFQLLIILYTAKWYRSPSVGNTVVLGLAYGLGMMTKLSCATMAVFTGPVMIYVWIKSSKTPDFWKIFAKGALFLAICAPLALWYPIRNLILFHQPLNYIPKMSPDHELYCGNYSVWERFLSFPVGHMFDRLFCLPVEDYNVALYLVKCSLFGEFEYTIAPVIPKLMVIVNILLILVSLAAAVFVAVKGKKFHPILRFGLPFLWLTQLISYYVFQIQYPFGCTMDFRYIAITAMIGAVMTGAALELLQATKEKLYKKVHLPVVALVCLFGALSMIMYCTII